MDSFFKDIYSVYPYKIRGNDGEVATLKGLTLAIDGEYIGVYRYPGGTFLHSLHDVQCFEVIERMPK